MKPTLLLFFVIVLFAFALLLSGPRSNARTSDSPATDLNRDREISRLADIARANGSVRVLVGLHMAFVPEGELPAGDITRQRASIKQAQRDLIARHPAASRGAVTRFEYIPFIALEADEDLLRKLNSDGLVARIDEDVIGEAALAESTPIVSAPAAWSLGYTGSGQTVAILDSGVDKNHAFLAGRVVSEACYSSNTATSSSVCPGGVTESTAPDSGLHCAVSGCAHGTNVAGIAAGRSVTASGVAKDANIVAIQMFSQFVPTTCGTADPCARYWTSDLIKALERVRTLKTTIPSLVAVNLSLQTSQQFMSNCDGPHAATKASVDNLRSLGVATIVCSGNASFTNAMAGPACISSAISVGSVDDGSSGTTANVVSNFSNSSPLLHLLAPGRWINSSIPGGVFQNYSGTSMAAPHVTGAYAILRQRSPNASVGRVLKALSVTGQPITDTRNSLVKPRINIAAALNAIDRTTPADFDDDGKTDIAIFRPAVAQWWITRSSNNSIMAAQFGAPTDRIVPGDYTGDGRADIAVWRPASGEWFVLRSEDFSFFAFPFGASGDVPMPQDFDGDGKTDPALFRPTNGTWYVQRSAEGSLIQLFGTDGDIPVAARFDNDARADIAIYRPSLGQWWLNRSSGGVIAMTFGNATDKPVPGDYTGDGISDVAFWRPSSGEWYVLRSEDFSFFAFGFGATGDIPAPGDYDGDGRHDATVFRPSNATWYSQRTTAGTLIQQFGATGDRPIPNAYVP